MVGLVASLGVLVCALSQRKCAVAMAKRRVECLPAQTPEHMAAMAHFQKAPAPLATHTLTGAPAALSSLIRALVTTPGGP